MSQAAATDPKPAPTSPPSFSEAAAAATTGTTTGTTSAAASPALQQHQQYQDQQPDEATPPTDQDVHEITAHLAAAAKHPSAATTVASFPSAAGTTAATSPTTPLSASNKSNDPSDSNVNPNPEGVLILDDDDDEVTSYWDAEAMAPLNPVSAVSRFPRFPSRVFRSSGSWGRCSLDAAVQSFIDCFYFLAYHYFRIVLPRVSLYSHTSTPLLLAIYTITSLHLKHYVVL